jgi:hypothetical protein
MIVLRLFGLKAATFTFLLTTLSAVPEFVTLITRLQSENVSWLCCRLGTLVSNNLTHTRICTQTYMNLDVLGDILILFLGLKYTGLYVILSSRSVLSFGKTTVLVGLSVF